jgi:subtilisin family serine protease
VAADLMAVVTASKTPKLSWAVDVNGVRYAKAIVVGTPSADPDLGSLRSFGTISSPGNDPSVITVGSANIKGTAVRSDDSVNFFSSRGPTRFSAQAVAGTVALLLQANPGLTPPLIKAILQYSACWASRSAPCSRVAAPDSHSAPSRATR